jgi:hypothetical protein
MKYYDTTTLGFYEEMADKRIEITDEYWQELLEKLKMDYLISVNILIFQVLILF